MRNVYNSPAYGGVNQSLSNLKTTLVYAYADAEQKRKAIEKSMGRGVIAGVDLPKYSVSDEEVLKKLYGLK